MVKKLFIFCVLFHVSLLASPTKPLLENEALVLQVNPYYLGIKKIPGNHIHRKLTNFDPDRNEEFGKMFIDVGEVSKLKVLLANAKANGVMLLLNTVPISRDNKTKKLVIEKNKLPDVFSQSMQPITETTDYKADDFTFKTVSRGCWCCKEEHEEYYFKGQRIYLNIYNGDADWIERWENISKLAPNTPVFFIESALHRRKKVPAAIALQTRFAPKTLE